MDWCQFARAWLPMRRFRLAGCCYAVGANLGAPAAAGNRNGGGGGPLSFLAPTNLTVVFGGEFGINIGKLQKPSRIHVAK